MKFSKYQMPAKHTASVTVFSMTENMSPERIIRHKIALIDSSVEDYQSLVDRVVEGTEIVLLDSSRDGVEQIT